MRNCGIMSACVSLVPSRVCHHDESVHSEKQKLVAAIACLKRAITLEPQRWRTQFNLGLVIPELNSVRVIVTLIAPLVYGPVRLGLHVLLGCSQPGS